MFKLFDLYAFLISLEFLLCKHFEINAIYVELPKLNVTIFTPDSHLQYKHVQDLCNSTNRVIVCNANMTNVCGVRIVSNGTAEYKDFDNLCYLFLENMCDNPGGEFYITWDGTCYNYFSSRRAPGIIIFNNYRRTGNIEKAAADATAHATTKAAARATTKAAAGTTKAIARATTKAAAGTTKAIARATTKAAAGTTKAAAGTLKAAARATTKAAAWTTKATAETTKVAASGTTNAAINKEIARAATTKKTKKTPTTTAFSPLYDIDTAYDDHICPGYCTDVYLPICICVNRGSGKYLKYMIFLNHCLGDMYYCKHWKEFQPPSEDDSESVSASQLGWSYCAATRYLQFKSMADGASSMGHYGWLAGNYKYSHILTPGERIPGYG